MAVKSLFSRMTFLDWLIVLSLLAGVGFSFFFAGQKKEGNLVIVEQHGKVIFSAPLDRDREEVFTGPVGETLMVILDHEVYIGRSDCPRKICMAMGHIHRNGEVIACVPNQILIRISGEEKGDDPEYDILSR
ncbi:MAG: NusG domain II-containing protein [Deltaproteobacteria bacterium]|nr:NusG domain II-containing protein [Deltaproteobacteria bacterium]